jgi:hypothetical protein
MPALTTLESRLAVFLGNAARIQKLPGRKKDVQECSKLHHGLLKLSFSPSQSNYEPSRAPALPAGNPRQVGQEQSRPAASVRLVPLALALRCLLLRTEKA